MKKILIAFLVAVSALAEPIRAQELPPDHWASGDWVGEAAFASTNALLAGLSAGVMQVIRKGSFRDGFAAGALGGAVAYAGRRVVVEDFWGAGLLGRQMSAVGSSFVRNAGDGNPLLSRMWFPIGPVILRVDNDEALRVRPIVDLYALTWLAAAGMDSRLEWNAGSSISAGAPVFQARGHRLRSDGEVVRGAMWGGVILLDQLTSADPESETLGHERTHVLQYDFAQLVWSDSAENYLLGFVPVGSKVRSFARIGVVGPIIYYGMDRLMQPSIMDLWEAEADFLDRR